MNARFVYHHLRNDFAKYLQKTSVHASVTSLRKPMFLNYPIHLPAREYQDKIANILDYMESLTSDLALGLPAEITTRRKQYEYYRDKLLTFEELKP